jgi:hypothetical protein
MDLQCFYFGDVMNIEGAEEVPDLVPRSLSIRGKDFDHAVRVLINDMDSPSWIINSRHQIIAQVPTALELGNVTSLEVLSADFTATARSKIIFELGMNTKKVSGLRLMMQTFLKILFTTPGTDVFVKKLGGGALQVVGKHFDANNTQNLVSDLSISIRRTEMQMIGLQSRQTRMPEDERLAAANILGVRLDPASTTLIARVELIAQSGKLAIANLEL